MIVISRFFYSITFPPLVHFFFILSRSMKYVYGESEFSERKTHKKNDPGPATIITRIYLLLH